MTRVRNHFDFACVFAGLGFTGAWALAPDRLAAFLSPGLQGAGIVMAAYAAVRLVVLIRNRRAAPEPGTPPPRKRRRQRPARIEPREHFGLRGTRR